MDKFIKVVIAEDDYIVRNGIERLIDWNQYGYNIVASFDNGVDLINYCENNDVDLIITDIEMPKKNGFEALNLLLEIKNYLNVIIISGFDKFDYAKKAIEKGAFNYLLKPINPEELIDTLIKLKDRINKIQVENIVYNANILQSKSIEDIISFIKIKVDTNCDHDLSLEKIAKKYFVNSNYLSRMFKEKVGESYIEYRNKIKIQLSKKLMNTTDYKLYEIAQIIGFEDERYFSRVFKKYENLSPIDYRRMNNECEEN